MVIFNLKKGSFDSIHFSIYQSLKQVTEVIRSNFLLIRLDSLSFYFLIFTFFICLICFFTIRLVCAKLNSKFQLNSTNENKDIPTNINERSVSGLQSENVVLKCQENKFSSLIQQLSEK
jgi:hypothetical protein